MCTCFAHWILPAIVLLSGFGALVMVVALVASLLMLERSAKVAAPRS